jgi:YD repeat-containing protein
MSLAMRSVMTSAAFAFVCLANANASLQTNVVERHYDRFGRPVGVSLNGERRTEIAYDEATGRIASMRVAGADEPFRWDYESGSDLKKTLRYPNGATVEWEYEAHRDLVTLVSNDVYSSYCYEYDAAGRRVAKNDERYEYNVRGELVLATNAVTEAGFAYCYDDIGNRLWSREFGTNCVYAANDLNQYTNIVRGGICELSAFDLDGNQTNIVTATGEWVIEYNGENRPVLWRRKSDGVTIRMSYDRMGRRVRKNDEMFVYDGYLNVSQTIWDPTEPIATRPLAWGKGATVSYLFHDGNKNRVNEVSGEAIRKCDFAGQTELLNDGCQSPWARSSEFHDELLNLVYYNYRFEALKFSRWTTREPLEQEDKNPYLLLNNNAIDAFDYLGLMKKCPSGVRVRATESGCEYRTNIDSGGRKRTNGCGAEGGIGVPNSFLGIVDFTGCCDRHDVCYGTCGSIKSLCDLGLGGCMAATCQKVSGFPSLHNACVAQAVLYAGAVLAFGGNPFESAQDEGCKWEACCCEE